MAISSATLSPSASDITFFRIRLAVFIVLSIILTINRNKLECEENAAKYTGLAQESSQSRCRKQERN
jgi:hypothetical protein